MRLKHITKVLAIDNKMLETEYTFLATGIDSELRGLKDKKAKEVGNKILQALLALRDGNENKARKLFKSI